MQDNKRDTRPNPGRHDELSAHPLASVRVGTLVGDSQCYASYGVWVGEYRRYGRFQWPARRLDTDSLLIWSEELTVDVYEAIRVAASRYGGSQAL